MTKNEGHVKPGSTVHPFIVQCKLDGRVPVPQTLHSFVNASIVLYYTISLIESKEDGKDQETIQSSGKVTEIQ